MQRNEKNYETVPVGSLGVIPLESCKELGKKINKYLVRFRKEREHKHENDISFRGYLRDTYLMECATPRFGTGEAKGSIRDSVRGFDLFLMVDVTNYSLTYKVCGYENRMSPDDHYQDLKRIIAAAGGKARRITVIMPFLYETVQPSYQFIKGIFREVNDLKIDSDHMMVVSPDEGSTNRAVYLANVLGLDMGMFYKRRDYSQIVDGRNPIVAHEFLGASVEGKDIFIIDDMISSGDSMIDVATELKKRKAGRIFVISTFGLFTNGLEKFDKAVEEGVIYKLVTTNLIYQTPELLSKDYYISCDMSKYIAYIIDTLNHDTSISDLLDPYERIEALVKKYKAGKKIK